MSNGKRVIVLLAGVSGLGVSLPAFAQAAADSGTDTSRLEEIVVTAQRRSESLQRVPIAVTAITSSQLAQKGLADTGSLEASVPSLSMSRNGSVVNPFLRGVGSNASNVNDEQSVATYVDGVYMATPIGNIFAFNNIERIEVLKGPQGTLFGRNATGGVIQVITRDPKHDPHAELSFGYGNYKTVSSSAYITGGLTEDIAADIAVVYRNRIDGLGVNLFNGDPTHLRRDFGIRSKWLLTPGSRTEIRLTADYNQSNSTGNDFQIPPGSTGIDGSTYPGRFNTNANFYFRADAKTGGVGLRIDQDLDFARFVSITSYRRVHGEYALDQDATPLPVVDAPITQRAHNVSQEVQLLAPKGSTLDWLVGAYYFNARYAYDPLHIGGLAAAPFTFTDIFSHQNTRSISVYGQATYEILPKLKLTGGLRYTAEKQKVSGHIDADPGTILVAPEQGQNFKKLTWRIALDYQLTEAVMGYISYNRGIKSGGFNLLSPTLPGYRPEVLDSYEAGLKTELFDRRLRFNIAAFHYKYSDIQVTLINSGALFATNAAGARINGVDIDFQAIPFQNFTISGGAGFLDTKYTNYRNATAYAASAGPATIIDATGNDTINSPHFTGSATATYRIPTDMGDFSVSGTVLHNSGYFAGADNRLRFPRYTVLNGAIDWAILDGGLDLQFWMKNITDKNYIDTRIETSLGDIQREADPRTYGVTLSAKF